MHVICWKISGTVNNMLRDKKTKKTSWFKNSEIAENCLDFVKD